MQTFIRFVILVSLASACMYGMAWLLFDNQDITLYHGLKSIYVFHWVLSVFVLSFIFTVDSVARKYTGFSFLGSSLFRLVAVVIFLYPLIGEQSYDSVDEVLYFMPPYFVLTAVEAWFTIRLIRTI